MMLKMRNIAHLPCIALALLCIQLAVGLQLVSGKHPDIVMIAIDDLRPMLGCYRDRTIKKAQHGYTFANFTIIGLIQTR